MFKLLMALLLLLPVGAFSNPGKVFPTPPGFTTDIQKEWTIAYNVPRYLVVPDKVCFKQIVVLREVHAPVEKNQQKQISDRGDKAFGKKR